MNIIFYIISILLLLFTSCKKEEQPIVQIDAQQGFYVVNEGNFTWGNSSLSFYDEQKNTVESNIFYKINGVPLGDVAMDMKIINNKGFITVNNSGMIYVVEPNNAKHVATITNFTSPRFILPINDSIAYVSDLYSPYISIINTKNFQNVGQIFVGRSTETMLLWKNKVFACNWSFGSKVYVMDALQHRCIDSIQVGLQPNSICIDKNETIWVLCDGGYYGNPVGHEISSLWKINPYTFHATKQLTFPSLNYPAKSLAINNSLDSLYFIWNDVYKYSISDTLFPQTAFVNSNGANFYHISIHPYKPEIIICNAKNYTSNGEISIWSINGQLIGKKMVGINPGTICFITQ